MSRRPRTPEPPAKAEVDRNALAPKLDHTLPRLAYRFDEVCKALGMSRRTMERERSAGRFPRPDLTIGKAPLWALETIRGWIERGGR